MICNQSTKRWNPCKNIARLYLRTMTSKLGLPVSGTPLHLTLCALHRKDWNWQLGASDARVLESRELLGTEVWSDLKPKSSATLAPGTSPRIVAGPDATVDFDPEQD